MAEFIYVKGTKDYEMNGKSATSIKQELSSIGLETVAGTCDYFGSISEDPNEIKKIKENLQGLNYNYKSIIL